jgi:carotenoid phi-ring synthase / carotenoid chi-ring synthase
MSLRGALRRVVRHRLGGRRVLLNPPDGPRPRFVLRAPPRVAVVGGGIAGLTSALVLGERGFSVTLFEKERELGGKLRSWPLTLKDGTSLYVSHGFHAFFRQYHNLRELLARIGASRFLVPVEDYLILRRGTSPVSFAGVDATPLLNLVDLVFSGAVKVGPLLGKPESRRLLELFRYDPVQTPADLDDVPFSRFAAEAGLPDDLRDLFATFARAFFAEPERISTAEMIKGFHLYFLGNDLGLLFDTLSDDFARSFAAPMEQALAGVGVEVRRGSAVGPLAREHGGLCVEGERFAHLVVAAEARASRALLLASPLVQAEDPALAARLLSLPLGGRYAVLRLFLDRRSRVAEGMPVFVFTDRARTLDSITFVERIDVDAAAWCARSGGSVVELHSYALPAEVRGEAEVRGRLVEEMGHFLPDLTGAEVLDDVLQVRDDFAAFAPGIAAVRPGPLTGVEGLRLAGDWVQLPAPAMLMEGACMAGLLAANDVLREQGLEEEPVYSVPLRGLLA